MRLILAPMQGVIDHDMRELLTTLGGFDRCVTEFIRVTDQQYPARTFYRKCPELNNCGRTQVGTPVYIQLLGGQPLWMAANAVRAAQLGALGIDLNFGCPAKTVNRNDGGSILLREPGRVAAIVAAVRDAVDPAIPVTAKIRLGFKDSNLLQDIVGGIVAAGADEICIHARTREDGYKPPAHWHHLKPVQQTVNIPVIVNGEIWSVPDALQAQSISACQDIMLGRGALACPDLARQIKCHSETGVSDALSWCQVLDLLDSYFEHSDQWNPRYVGNRTKQWLAYLRRQYASAEVLFEQIKGLRKVPQIKDAIARHRCKESQGEGLHCA